MLNGRGLARLAGALGLVLVLAACGAEPEVAEAPAGETTPAATETPDASDASDDDDGDTDEADDGDQADVEAEDPGPHVVSTVAPLADIVAQVMDGRGEVTGLIPEGMDSHTYEPRPGDVAPLTEADAFIGNGLALNEAAVQLAEANLPEDAPLVLLGEETLDDAALSDEHWHSHDDGHSHDHDHDHDHGHSHDHDHDDGHSHDDSDEAATDGQVNPHVWTSVPNMMRYTERIAEVLTELDPDGAEHYDAAVQSYLDELEQLDAAIRDAVETVPDERRRLVVYHDAWAYFGEEYGVEVIAAVQPSDFSEPSASDVRAIIDQVRDHDVPALFGSEEFPSDVVEVIADETGAAYVGDLADDQLPGEPGDAAHSYVGMMATNTATVVDHLGGDAEALAAFR